MNKQKYVGSQRLRRRRHARNRLRGDTERPRLCVVRSNKHIYCQVIDDLAGKTLVSASTRDADVRSDVARGGNIQAAEKIGARIAEKALAAGIKQVKFDRGHARYHGRLAALADAARKGGLSL